MPEVIAKSPTGLDRPVSVDVDPDAREIVVTVGDEKARFGAEAALAFRQHVDSAWLAVA